MKIAKKIVLIINIIFCIFLSVGIPRLTYADELDPYNYEPSGNIDDKFVNNYGAKAKDYLFYISVIVSVISIMLIGLKYIMGSVQEKAKYKESLIPVLVGVFIVSFITSILSWLAKFAETI